MYCILVLSHKFHQKSFILLLCFIGLSAFYALFADINSSFRAIKTLLVFLPVILATSLYNVRVSKVLHYFIFINAFFVYLDFATFYSMGFTLTRAAFSGYLLRLGGLMEDSNFFFLCNIDIHTVFVSVKKQI
jgi:hypothetical protein